MISSLRQCSKSNSIASIDLIIFNYWLNFCRIKKILFSIICCFAASESASAQTYGRNVAVAIPCAASYLIRISLRNLFTTERDGFSLYYSFTVDGRIIVRRTIRYRQLRTGSYGGTPTYGDRAYYSYVRRLNLPPGRRCLIVLQFSRFVLHVYTPEDTSTGNFCFTGRGNPRDPYLRRYTESVCLEGRLRNYMPPSGRTPYDRYPKRVIPPWERLIPRSPYGN